MRRRIVVVVAGLAVVGCSSGTEPLATVEGRYSLSQYFGKTVPAEVDFPGERVRADSGWVSVGPGTQIETVLYLTRVSPIFGSTDSQRLRGTFSVKGDTVFATFTGACFFVQPAPLCTSPTTPVSASTRFLHSDAHTLVVGGGGSAETNGTVFRR